MAEPPPKRANTAGAGEGAAAATPLLTVLVTATSVAPLPASFGAGRTAEELRAFGGQLQALTDEVNAAAAAAVEAAVVAAADARVTAAAAHNASKCELYDELCGVQDFRNLVYDVLTWPQLLRLRVDTLSRGWVDEYLERVGYTMRRVDMLVRVSLLHHFVRIPHARVVLPKGEYELPGGNEANAAHLLNEPRGAYPGISATSAAEHADALAVYDARQPEWREGYDLLISDDVTLVGQESVVPAWKEGPDVYYFHRELDVPSKRVRFESMTFRTMGLNVVGSSSMTMDKCTVELSRGIGVPWDRRLRRPEVAEIARVNGRQRRAGGLHPSQQRRGCLHGKLAPGAHRPIRPRSQFSTARFCVRSPPSPLDFWRASRGCRNARLAPNQVPVLFIPCIENPRRVRLILVKPP